MAQALRSTRVLTAEGLAPATLIIDGEKIGAIRAWHEVRQSEDLHDFGDLLLLPGLVDSHVHINDPGRDWEGFDTATRAAASGGVTTLVDMPLNCVPETVTVDALEAKRRAASGRTWVDWAAWGGVVKGNADAVPALAKAGVAGFKCFMIHSGIDGFAWVNESDLRTALAKLRGTKLPLLVHAEVAGPVEAATAAVNRDGANWQRYATYLASRPDAAEIDAIKLLIRLAQEYQTAIHIVHLSSAKALPILAEARSHGVPITVETCVHYLALSAEQIPDGATEFKCAPPVRDEANCQQLWAALESGLIDLVATDHSPCPPAMKQRDVGRWDLAWGGIASLGLALPVLWTVMRQRGLSTDDAAARVAKWMATRPSQLAGLFDRKGSIAVGIDADVAVFDAHISWTVTQSDLHFRHQLSPYLGAKLRGRVQETWLRGKQVYADGQFQGDARGRELVRT